MLTLGARTLTIWVAAIGAIAAVAPAHADLGPRNPVNLTNQSTVAGAVAGDRAGGAVLVIPDYNGDAFPDVAVGMPGVNGDTGGVALFFGAPDRFVGELEIADADVILKGEHEGDEAGFALAEGDFNGDGLSDIVVGAPGYNEERGAAYVVFGAGLVVGDPHAQRLDLRIRFSGQTVGDRAGHTVAAPDMDGDGFADLVAGAPFSNYGGVDGGRVYMTWGDSGTFAGWDSDSFGNAEVSWFSSFDTNLGYAIAKVPNFNGDEREDLLIGGPGGGGGFIHTNSRAGRVFLLLGAPKQAFSLHTSIDSYNDGHYVGEQLTDFAGGAVACLGDVTGNGLDDFIIGAPLFDADGKEDAGAAYVIRGKRSGFSFSPIDLGVGSIGSYYGYAAHQWAGFTVNHTDDLNQDYMPEILVSAPASTGSGSTEVGEVFVLKGKDDDWEQGEDLASSPDVLGSFVGVTEGGLFGTVMSAPADLDDDGRPEIILAAPGGEVGGEAVGVLYVMDIGAVQDADGDGYSISGGDCDDYDNAVYPSAPEVPYDGADQDCDGEDLRDVDGDGYEGTAVGGDDCNDEVITIFPGASETPYDGEDQDCDGSDLTDVDGDGADATVVGGSDCDDNDTGIGPDATEIPYDGIDQNCDGGDLTDVDGDGYDSDIASVGGDDCNDNNASAYPGATETPYDEIDQDCDGSDLIDVDGDGADAEIAGGDDCNDNDSAIGPQATEVCDGIDGDCDDSVDEDFDVDEDGFTDLELCPETGADCDDDDATSYPGAAEVCDEADNNCDGQVDEDLPLRSFWIDADGDGYGDENEGSSISSCLDEMEGFAPNQTDCDDSNAAVNPGEEEIPGNGEDDDCDVSTTDDDLDGDSYASVEYGGDDCDDGDPEINPGASEIPYDGIDQDCDGADLTDRDADGYSGGEDGDDCDDDQAEINPGAADVPYDGIDQDCDGADLTDIDGDGWSGGEDGNDCDDGDAEVNPGASEQCNGKDDDCDGNEDEGCSEIDADGDGFFANDDCDDANPDAYPNAIEFCDSEVDLNCDGKIGSECATLGGGFGCDASQGQSQPMGLALLALLTLGLRRRRRVAALAALALLGAAGVAQAQTASPPVELNQLLRPMEPNGLVATVSPEGLIQRQYAFNVFVNYLNKPVSLHYDGGESQVLIGAQEVIDITAAYGLTRWLQMGVGIPVVATQVTETGDALLGSVGGLAPRNARLQFKLSPPRLAGGFGLALVPELRLPLSPTGRAALDVLASVQRQMGRLRVIANGGYRAFLGDASRANLLGYEVTSSGVLLRGGVAFAAVPELVDLVADVWGQAGQGGDAPVNTAPVEGAVGVHIHPNGGFYVMGGGGVALSSGVGAPRGRAFVGMGYASTSGLTDADSDGDGVPDVWDECRRVREDLDGWLDTDGCPDFDNDGDGVEDESDECPDTAEDGDGWEDEDGCPDIDNDSDDIPDSDDLCADEPEDLDGFEDEDGCPDLDNDGDGVYDSADACPSTPEGADGDGDGCPDNDNDQDGVLDSADQCPDRNEDLDGWQDDDGCPDYDNDGDGLPDFDDFCPDEAEELNGFRDDDGCPESGPQVVRVRNEIRVLDEIFFEGGVGGPDPKSQGYLDQVVALIQAEAPGTQVVIEVHSDNEGDPADNKAMTQAQAQQVEAYLVSKGLTRDLLAPEGFGQERPLATNRTERGRERNRRVVFILKAPASE